MFASQNREVVVLNLGSECVLHDLSPAARQERRRRPANSTATKKIVDG